MVGFKNGCYDFILNNYISSVIEEGFDYDDDTINDTIPAYLEGAYNGNCYVALKSIEGNDMIVKIIYGIFDIDTEEDEEVIFELKLFNINKN